MLKVNFFVLPLDTSEAVVLLGDTISQAGEAGVLEPIDAQYKKDFLDFHFGDQHSMRAQGKRVQLSTGALLEVYNSAYGWQGVDWICYRYIVPGVGARIFVYGEYISQSLFRPHESPVPMWQDQENMDSCFLK